MITLKIRQKGTYTETICLVFKDMRDLTNVIAVISGYLPEDMVTRFLIIAEEADDE